MALRVLDEIALPGGNVNEDRIGATQFDQGAAAWVIDGATGLADRELVPEGPTDAAWLAEHLSRLLASIDPADRPPRAYFRGLIEELAGRYRAVVPAIDTVPPYALPSAAAMWLRHAGTRIELAWQGDCVAVVGLPDRALVFGAPDDPVWEDGINRVVEERLTRSPHLEQSLLTVLSPELRARRARLNQPDGYWMLGIDPRAADAMETAVLDLVASTPILLVSDGLWRLVQPFRQYDAAELLEAARHRGLEALMGELRALEAADAECRRVPRVKARDDASGMLLEIAPD
ncbi:MAG TPA: hypothetical protein VNT30_10320 [Stellaceae bacterium]|nr:hypothetical protein [Stellaceae bacterium]